MADPHASLSFQHVKTLLDIAFQLTRHIERGLSDNDLVPMEEFQVLMLVAQRSDVEQRCIANDLVEMLPMPESSAKRVIKRMILNGLLSERPENAWGNDRRRRQLTITNDGATHLKAAMVEWQRIMKDTLAGIDRSSIPALATVLESLRGIPATLDRNFRLDGSRDAKSYQ